MPGRRRSGVKGAQLLKQGDIVTVRGKGRVVLSAVETTKKDRFSVEMQRYL
jgi:RNA-binding protein YlmH